MKAGGKERLWPADGAVDQSLQISEADCRAFQPKAKGRDASTLPWNHGRWKHRRKESEPYRRRGGSTAAPPCYDRQISPSSFSGDHRRPVLRMYGEPDED
nr:unnamed protein product [Digitaria exilis]